MPSFQMWTFEHRHIKKLGQSHASSELIQSWNPSLPYSKVSGYSTVSQDSSTLHSHQLPWPLSSPASGPLDEGNIILTWSKRILSWDQEVLFNFGKYFLCPFWRSLWLWPWKSFLPLMDFILTE